MNTAISKEIRKRAIDKYSKAKNRDNFVSYDLSNDNDTSLVKAGSS
ncbi:conjugal transfer protein [Streptococcus agalactiae]|nr:conjugal transfer protein [Streptococcus agalactiae]